MKLRIPSIITVLMLLSTVLFGQNQNFDTSPLANLKYYHIFDADSLKGFQEDAVRSAALNDHIYGSEFKVKMYYEKRRYINNKYDLWPKNVPDYSDQHRGAVLPGCVNEDFEASTAGAVTTSAQVNGWVITRGVHGTGSDACNLVSCCPQQPSESSIISAPTGLIDPNIGSAYPIYSIFGSTPGPTAANTVNSHVTQGMFGNTFLRLNSDNNDSSIEKLSKTFSVTASNALFQFAFINVFDGPHACCEAGAFKARILSGSTVLACPSFTVFSASSSCSVTAPFTTYKGPTTAPATPAIFTPSAGLGGSLCAYNKWNVNSLDLSSYIGQNITLEFTISDCIFGGHYTYCYFDAQCGPMVVYGNNNAYQAGSGNVTVPTCGASGATICASFGLGPYSWAGPNVPPSYAVPSLTNTCFVTNLSATYTLYMNPAGACAPISRVIQSTITPAPTIFASAVQATCGQTQAAVSVTTAGSSSVNVGALSWSPTPLSLNLATTVATYSLPLGPSPLISTITVTDLVGCKASATAEVYPAAPIPTFAITNAGPSYSITCSNPSIDLNAVTGYTYGTLNYFWASQNATFNTSNAQVLLPATYTITAVDPVTFCSATRTLGVFINTVSPVVSVSPPFQNITCNVTSVSQVTLAATNVTVNVTHQILSPLGSSLISSNYLTYYPPGGVGIYTCLTTNDVNGCTKASTFQITSNQGFPIGNIQSSPANFTIGCTTKSVTTINIFGGQATNSLQVGNGGPVTYTLLSPSSSSVLPSGPLNPSSSYTANSPGTWIMVIKDNTSFCETRIPFSIISNTAGPSLDVFEVPRDILTCETPSVILKATSLTQSVSYNWTYPGPIGNTPTNTLLVNANFTVAQTQTLVANYSLTLTDDINTCKTFTVIPIRQNLFKPNASIANAGLTPITCKTTSLTLTNNSTKFTPNPFPSPLPVVGSVWMGPSPQESFSNTSTYVALVPGVFTMVARDANNGCEATATITILDDRNYPDVTVPSVTLDCGRSSKLVPITVPVKDLAFQWSPPEGASISTSTLSFVTVISPGDYNVLVTNTINGCAVRAVGTASANTIISVSFEPSTVFGYAPLTVSFVNTSSTSASNSSINSVWNFGNNKTATSSSTSVSPTTTFNSPGIYTVTLYSNSGICLGSTTKTINVEIPSTLSVPNVFTPNGDGINDLYFLKVTNLSQITATIYDRWGVKVYDVDTQNEKNNAGNKENVNLAWDGKNQYGIELPQASYFYVIKATGKDGKEYTNKGTITLIR
jgi:gliding motility-associated-like protein